MQQNQRRVQRRRSSGADGPGRIATHSLHLSVWKGEHPVVLRPGQRRPINDSSGVRQHQHDPPVGRQHCQVNSLFVFAN